MRMSSIFKNSDYRRISTEFETLRLNFSVSYNKALAIVVHKVLQSDSSEVLLA